MGTPSIYRTMREEVAGKENGFPTHNGNVEAGQRIDTDGRAEICISAPVQLSSIASHGLFSIVSSDPGLSFLTGTPQPRISFPFFSALFRAPGKHSLTLPCLSLLPRLSLVSSPVITQPLYLPCM